MLVQFTHQWLEAVWQYCHRHAYETLEVTYYLMRYRIGTQTAPKRDGNLYLSVDGDTINGIAFFNVKGVLFINYETEDLFKKVDFLKAIHREQPRQVRGQRQQVERLFTFLQRILKDFSFYKMQVMTLPQERCQSLREHQSSEQQSLPETSIVLPPGLTLMDAHQVDWLLNGKFLLAVEQKFRTHTLTINNLRHKIHQRQEFDFYKVLVQADRVVGQVVGEFSTAEVGLIGGLYIAPSARRQGLASALCREAIHSISSQEKIPALYVADDNVEAISLYRSLGFETQTQMLDLCIKL